MDERIISLRRHLKSRLSPQRFEHSLSVSFTSVALAMRYGYDINIAELAGLLHDCAKCYSKKELIEKCQKHGIELTSEEIQIGETIHAKYGAWMAAHKYGITDDHIISAIRYHCTGKPAMDLLEKIIYVADYIEPRRDKVPDLKHFRALAFQNLDQAVYEILASNLKYLQSRGASIDPMTPKAFEYYQEKEREKA